MKELTIEEMKEVNAGKACAAGYSCIGGMCWAKIELPDGSEVWGSDFNSCV